MIGMGVAVLLAGQTLNDDSYAQAAAQQLGFLLNVAPRAPNGAISHRMEQAQLVCMSLRFSRIRLTFPVGRLYLHGTSIHRLLRSHK